MGNLREVSNDLLKDWIAYREENFLCNLNNKDKQHIIEFEEISEKILNNVPKQNLKYVEKQLELLNKNYMDYHYYWNEKYYRNGFCDAFDLLKGSYKK